MSTLLISCGGGSDNAETVNTDSSLSPDSFVNQEVFIDEGNDSESVLIFTFSAENSGVIKYSSYDIDAVAKSDYQEISGSLDVIAGDSYTLEIPVFSDSRIEASEKLGVLLTDANDNKLATFIGTLVNDDFPTVLVTSDSITEGDVGNQILKYTITLSEETVAPFAISILTIAESGTGYATSGIDYTPLDYEIVFYAGEISQIVEVEIFGDTEIEPDEVVNLTATYESVTTEAVAGVIRTDDLPGSGAPTFVVNNGRSLQVAENTTSDVYQMPFSIDDDGGFTESFIINYYLVEYRDSTSSNTTELAKIDVDFKTSLGQVSIIPGQVDYIAEFSILDDFTLENVEILEFILANDSGVEFGSGRIYISDNESPEFKIYRKYNDESGTELTSTELTYAESSALLGEHNIYIEMSDPVGYDYEFEYTLRLPNNGEATASVDSDDFITAVPSTEIESKTLTVLNGSISPAGDSAYSIDFKINDDLLVEAHESFFIELRNSSGTLIGEAVEVKIINDDMPKIVWQAENAESNINNVISFLESIPLSSANDLGLSISLDNGIGTDAAALEDYDLTVTRSVVSNGSCSWRESSELSNDELLISGEGSQVFSRLTSTFNLNATSIDDELVECDESVELTATLTSQVSGINSSITDTINLVSLNDDKAFLDVYGFSANEADGNTSFQLKVNADINLDAEVNLTTSDAETDDASFTFDGITVDVDSTSATTVTFQEGAGVSNQVIIANILDDNIVELSESYELTVGLSTPSGLPVGLRYCELGLTPECTEISSSSTTATVTGTIQSEDELVLSITGKSGDSVSEADLTAVNLLDSVVQYPYKVSVSNEIASDIPTIELSLSDKCLILTASECAGSSDFEISNTLIHAQGSQSYAGDIDLGFKLLANDEMVEPDEISNIEISLLNSASLQTVMPSWVNTDISYSILNDDLLTFSFSGASAASQDEQDSGSITTGIGVSWDKAIASNVLTMNFALSETCDELVDSFCVVTSALTGSITGDIEAPLSVNIHTYGTDTLSTITPVDFGVKIIGDTAIEPNETAQLTVSLETQNTLNEILSATWVNWLTSFTINNDDTFMPTLEFTSATGVSAGNVITANGDESIENIGITLGWTEDISSNVTDINFVITSICSAEYSSGSGYAASDCDSANLADFSHSNGYQLQNQTSSEIASLDFLITDNDVVEPDEIITITIELGSTPSHYFTDSSAFPSLEYKIENDDFLAVSFNGQSSVVTEGNTGSTDLGVSASWAKIVAANVPPIVLAISEVCDNTINNHCVADTGDLNTPSSVVIHAGGIDTQAGSSSFNVEAVGDVLVEPNELVEIATSYMDASFLSDYLVSSADTNITVTINNDDVISPTLTFADLTATSNANETSSGSNSIDILLAWGDNVIADNTDDLNFVINDSCTTNNPSNTSCESSDFIIASVYNLINQPALGSSTLAFSIVGDEVVEPSESVSIDLLLDANTPSHYFPSSGYIPPTVTHTITNDDKITPYFTAATSSANEGSIDTAAGIKIGWNKVIAANVPDLALTVNSACAVNGCTVASDFNFSASESVSVFTSGSDKAAPGVTGELLGLIITGDAMVEPSEDVILTLGSSDTDYIEFASTPSHTRTITNDDKVTPYFIGSSAALDEGTSGLTSADVKFTWDQIIAANVPSLDVSLTSRCATNGCTLSQDINYGANETISIFTTGIEKASPGVTGHSTGLSISGDTSVEPSEVVSLSISSGVSSYIDTSANPGFEFTITNDDKVSPYFVASSSSLLEGDSGFTAAPVAITWDEDIAANADSISLSIDAGCATNGCSLASDSNFSSNQTLTIFTTGTALPSPGITGIDAGLTLEGDEVVEPNEILTLTLSPTTSTYVAIGSGLTHAVTLNNDDKIAPYFTAATSTVNEGSSDNASGVKVGWDKVIAANVPDLALTVNSACAVNGCTIASDFNFSASESVSVFTTGSDKAAPGSAGESIGLIINGDTMVEPSEDITITLSSSDTDYIEFTSTPSHTRTITNDDKVIPYFIGSSAALNEGASGLTSADIKFTWDQVIAANVPSLDVSLVSTCSANGCTLAQDINYSANETISIFTTGTDKPSPGVSGQNTGLTIAGDTLVEPSEIVNLSISSVVSTYIDTSANPGFDFTITNDDKISPYFIVASSSLLEGDVGSTAAPIAVTWDQNIAANADSLTLSIDASCATNGCDLTSDSNFSSNQAITIFTTGTALPSPGVTGIDVGLSLDSDEVVEPDEILTLTLSPTATTYLAVGSGLTHAVTLNNDDKIAPYFTAATSSVNEGSSDNASGVKVGWDKVIAANVPDLTLTVSSTCAVNGCTVASDFNFSASESVSVFTTGSDKTAPGVAGESLGLIITGDTMVEPSEDVTLTLSSSDTDYIEFASTPAHTRTITNDDKVIPYFIGSSAALDEGTSGQTSAEVKFTWDQAIATNVPSLDVSLTSACAVNGCTLAQDINYGANQTISIFTTGADQASPGVSGQTAGLTITGDTLVEPSEVVSLSISSSASTYIDTSTNPGFDFTITNDDKVAPYFVAASSSLFEGDAGSTPAPVAITWDQDIASNAASLSLSIEASCTANGCNLTSDSNFSSSETLSIFTTGTALSSPGVSGIDIGLTLDGDEIVEPDEVLTLTLSETASSYIAISTGQTHAITLNNDDKISPYFTAATSSASEGNSDAASGVKVGWDKVIAANVPDLALTVNSTCTVNGCTVAEDFNFTASKSVSVFTTGSDKAAPGSTGESLGLIITGDSMVEPTEDVILTLGTSDTDYIEFASTPSHTHTITNDDTVNISVADVSVLESATANIAFVWTGIIAKNVPAFDLGISMLCQDVTVTSTCNMTGYDDFSAQSTVSLRTNAEVADITNGNILLNVPLTNDSNVEPTEIIDVDFTIPPAIQPYFSSSTIPSITLSIENDDVVDISYVTSGTNESDGGISLAWNAYRIEGFDNVSFQLTTGVSSNSSVEDAAGSDYSISGTLCSGAGVCSIDVTSESLSSATSEVIAFAADDIIELNEEFSISLAEITGTAPISIPAVSSSNMVITNDDVLTFSLVHGTETSAGNIVAAGPSVMIAENSLADSDGSRLNLIVCNSSSQAMAGGSLVLDISYSTQGHQTPSTAERIVNADVASDIVSSVSAVTVTGLSGCEAYPLITGFTEDNTTEGHEWFAITANPNSSDVRCINSTQCMGSSTGLDDDGLVVIANDDIGSFADTGNDQCLDSSGNLVSYNDVACDPAGQDVELTRTELSFVRLTSEGYPTLEQEHSCIADGSSGYVWARYGSSATAIPEVSAQEVMWDWSGGTNDAVTQASTPQSLCGKSSWVMPELDDLVTIADLDWLNSTALPFNHNATTAMRYWASQACYVDGDGSTLGHYAFDYQTGTSLCLADTSELHIRMLAK